MSPILFALSYVVVFFGGAFAGVWYYGRSDKFKAAADKATDAVDKARK